MEYSLFCRCVTPRNVKYNWMPVYNSFQSSIAGIPDDHIYKGATCEQCGKRIDPTTVTLHDTSVPGKHPMYEVLRCPTCGYICPNHSATCPLNYLSYTPEKPMTTEAPKSETLSPGVDQIPYSSLEDIGAIFSEGEKKYGRDNWKQQPDNAEYNAERTRHAIRHLYLWANGDRSEPHLAKVAWFCVTTLWREKQK